MKFALIYATIAFSILAGSLGTAQLPENLESKFETEWSEGMQAAEITVRQIDEAAAKDPKNLMNAGMRAEYTMPGIAIKQLLTIIALDSRLSQTTPPGMDDVEAKLIQENVKAARTAKKIFLARKLQEFIKKNPNFEPENGVYTVKYIQNLVKSSVQY